LRKTRALCMELRLKRLENRLCTAGIKALKLSGERHA